MKANTYFITGGLGFIGAHFVHHLHTQDPSAKIVVIDKITYAANPTRLADLLAKGNCIMEEANIANEARMQALFTAYTPQIVINFAAESHVDNSIAGPAVFLETNVKGTFTLLEAARKLWMESPNQIKSEYQKACFYHISTDEVFGSLGEKGAFNEQSNYAPNSPYSASKAAADHWVRSYHHTYGLPTLLSYCSNNFGPFQHAEKLIPTIVRNALKGNDIPIYGNGKNIRDWLYVEDHCTAISSILARGKKGETYAIGGNNEHSNIALCDAILTLLDKIHPKGNGTSYRAQIKFVSDRPGHDYRYAIDPIKIQNELGWKPKVSFENALEITLRHYLEQYLKG